MLAHMPQKQMYMLIKILNAHSTAHSTGEGQLKPTAISVTISQLESGN